MKEGILVGSWYNENSSSKNYLVFEEDNSEAKFDTVLVGMAVNNSINGIVPFVFSQQNSRRYVRFDVTSKLTLPQLLEKTLNKKRLVNLFSSICETVANLKNYMINDGSVMLDAEYIYVDVSTAKAYLILNPLLESQHENNYLNFFRSIIVNAKFDESEDNSYVAHVLSLLNSNSQDFSPEKFNKSLKEMNAGISNSNDTKSGFSEISQPAVKPYEPSGNFSTVANVNSSVGNVGMRNVHTVTPQPDIPINSGGINIPAAVNTPSTVNNEKKKKGSDKMSKLFSFGKSRDKEEKAAAVKKDKKGKKSKPKGKLPGFAIPGMTDKSQVKQPAAAVPTPAAPDFNQANQMSVPPQQPQQIQNPVMVNYESQNSYNEYDDDNATTLMDAGGSNSGNPVLTRVRNGEMAEINKDHFVIGKEKNFADYCITNNSAVSRSHAFIVNHQGLYYIVDTNSKNHTYINGMKIESNKEVLLHSSDRIRFANEEFVFNI